jgi:hypothetical protein
VTPVAQMHGVMHALPHCTTPLQPDSVDPLADADPSPLSICVISMRIPSRAKP